MARKSSKILTFEDLRGLRAGILRSFLRGLGWGRDPKEFKRRLGVEVRGGGLDGISHKLTCRSKSAKWTQDFSNPPLGSDHDLLARWILRSARCALVDGGAQEVIARVMRYHHKRRSKLPRSWPHPARDFPVFIPKGHG